MGAADEAQVDWEESGVEDMEMAHERCHVIDTPLQTVGCSFGGSTYSSKRFIPQLTLFVSPGLVASLFGI